MTKTALDCSLDELQRVVAKWTRIALAAKELVESKSSTIRARNGRHVGVEDECGEKMWIVPFTAMDQLEAALEADASDGVLPNRPITETK